MLEILFFFFAVGAERRWRLAVPVSRLFEPVQSVDSGSKQSDFIIAGGVGRRRQPVAPSAATMKAVRRRVRPVVLDSSSLAVVRQGSAGWVSTLGEEGDPRLRDLSPVRAERGALRPQSSSRSSCRRVVKVVVIFQVRVPEQDARGLLLSDMAQGREIRVSARRRCRGAGRGTRDDPGGASVGSLEALAARLSEEGVPRSGRVQPSRAHVGLVDVPEIVALQAPVLA